MDMTGVVHSGLLSWIWFNCCGCQRLICMILLKILLCISNIPPGMRV